MKTIRLHIFIYLLGISTGLFALNPINPSTNNTEDSTKNWKFTSLNMLGINQIVFVNWSTGGESSLSAKIGSEYDLEYKKRRFTFDHGAKLAFGLVGYIDKRIEKTDDIMDLWWAVSHKTSKNWSLSSLLTFKSQFANGYQYPNDTIIISKFMAPGYINISVGFNFKPDKTFQLYLSPVAGKLTMVLDEQLANKGSYGVKKAVYDTAGNVIVPGGKCLAELGVKAINFL